MRVISQRELRNDNAEVMRDVERGESFTVTRRGVPVARLVPLDGPPDVRCERPARVRITWTGRSRAETTMSTADVLDDLRADR